MRGFKRFSLTVVPAVVVALIGSTMVAPVLAQSDPQLATVSPEHCLPPAETLAAAATTTTTTDASQSVLAAATALVDRDFGWFDCDGKSHYKYKLLGIEFAQELTVTNVGSCSVTVKVTYRGAFGRYETEEVALAAGEGISLSGTFREISVLCDESKETTSCRFNVRRVKL